MANHNEKIADNVLPWSRLGSVLFGMGIMVTLTVGFPVLVLQGRHNQSPLFYLSFPLLLFGWWLIGSWFRISVRAFRGIKRGTSARSIYDMHLDPDQTVLLGPIDTGQRFNVFVHPFGLEHETKKYTRLTLDVLNESGNVVRTMTTRKTGNGLWLENGFGVKSKDHSHFLRLTLTCKKERTENYQFDFAVEVTTRNAMPVLPERWHVEAT